MELGHDLGQDLRYCLRWLARAPGFTAVVVITLALGIGANTAIFSLVNGVLLRPLPFPHPQQLVRVYSEFPTFPHGGLHKFWISGPEYLELRQNAHAFQSLDAWTTDDFNLSGSARPLRVHGARVTGGLLSGLGVQPALGRTLTASDDQPGAARTAVISWPLFQQAFAGNRGVVGQTTQLNGGQCTIVGVMPAGFNFPLGETEPVEMWTPLQLNPAKPGGWASHYLYLLGRLRPGVNLAQAQGEMRGLVAGWTPMGHSAHQHNFTTDNHPLSSYLLQDEVTGGVRPALELLLWAVGFVLLIACVNVASVLLARAEARQREISIRGALGARRSRLLRQFITEGLVLATAGAAAGVGLAAGALQWLKTAQASGIPRIGAIGLDGRVLSFALLLALGTGILFGLTPLAHVSGAKLFGRLKAAGTGSGGSPAAQRFRQALVVVEMALALVLLTGAGLMVRGFWNLQHVDLGFQPDGVTTMQVALPPSAPNNQVDLLTSRLSAGLQHLPGVNAAALALALPPNRPPNDNDTDIEGFVKRPGGPIENVEFYQIVSPSYFKTLQIPLLAGRLFDERDGTSSPPVVVVNQRMAETFWPNQSPLGHRVRPDSSMPWFTVVGEVADVKNKGVSEAAGTELYFAIGQTPAQYRQQLYILTRSARGTAPDGGAVNAVREMVHAADPALPLAHVDSLSHIVSRDTARPQLLLMLLLTFAGVALALAAVGIYGVMSYAVARRRREFGLRAAIGAQPASLLGMVMRQALVLAVIGAAVGIGVALAAGGIMRGLVYGVGTSDPATLALVALVLIVVALAACWAPAARAMRVDPVTALRDE
ncbi:MAG TPA: ABC transporter permease [Terriglobales bacterium]